MKYATVYSDQTICSWHSSRTGAERAARQCEAAGGFAHEIWEVKKLARAQKLAAKQAKCTCGFGRACKKHKNLTDH